MTLPRTPSFRLDGQRALVTGGSSGIGAASAMALAEAGADVVIVARGAERLPALVRQIREAGLEASGQVLDITDTAAVSALVAELGPFDILVNSAGLARHSRALETRGGDFDAVFDVNVRAAYFVTRTVARSLVAAGKPGSLINISSQMGHVGGPDRAVYCATKHAVEGFTKAMAIEWGAAGIRVNTICPTFILTPLSAPSLEDPEIRSWILSKIKLGRVGRVEDVMGGVVYLASAASAMVTGTSLMIDGGWTAG